MLKAILSTRELLNGLTLSAERMNDKAMTNRSHFAGFWRRLIADMIDSLILDLAALLIVLMGLGIIFWLRVLGLLPAVENQGTLLHALSSFGAQVFAFAVTLLLSFGYYSWATYKYGTTLGKRIFNIYVVNANTLGPLSLEKSILRSFCYFLSYLPMGAGFLMIAFHPEKRGLHDVVAGTVAIVRKRAS